MPSISINTATDYDARVLSGFLKTMEGISQISIAKTTVSFVPRNGFSPPPEKEKYDWINPTRPATDAEWEEMIAEAEAEYKNGLVMTAEKSRMENDKKVKEWLSRHSK